MVDPVVGRPPKDEFEVKRVEFGDEEAEDDAEDDEPALQRGQRVPRELDPGVRAERAQNFDIGRTLTNKRPSVKERTFIDKYRKCIDNEPELGDDSLHLPPVSRYVPQTPPIVFLHR